MLINNDALLDLSDIRPGTMTLAGLGEELHRLMQLRRIPREDVTPLTELIGNGPEQAETAEGNSTA